MLQKAGSSIFNIGTEATEIQEFIDFYREGGPRWPNYAQLPIPRFRKAHSIVEDKNY